MLLDLQRWRQQEQQQWYERCCGGSGCALGLGREMAAGRVLRPLSAIGVVGW